MITALTLSLALGAPVPAPADKVPAGTAPRLMELKPDANGKVTVTVLRTEMQKVQVGAAIAPGGAPGAVPPVNAVREVPVARMATVELGEVKNLTITTADGKKLEKEEALKKLAGGAIVVVSGDGKPVSPAFLKVFKDDTLVLASPELAAPAGAVRPPIGGRPVPLPAPVPPGGVQILPVQPGNVQVIPVQGNGVNGVIQVQVGPAAPAVDLPAVLPAAPPAKAPEKKEKNEK